MRTFTKRIFFAFVLVALLLAIGTVFYNYAEHWSYVDSFYFSTMTLTTIGYGDLAPTTEGAKIFTSFYAIFGIGIMLYILSSVIGVFVFRQEKHMNRAISFIGRLRRHDPDRKERELSELKKQVEKPFIRKFKKQQKEIRKMRKTLKPSIEQQQKEIRELKEDVTPTIKKFKKQQKEFKSLKKRIKRK
jgi:voltage-gated potassium channel